MIRSAPIPPFEWLPRHAAWILALLLLAGCRATPPSPQIPVGFDLSGAWRLVAAESDTPPTVHVLRARGGMLHLVVQDFPILRAQRMIIEQDRESMGLSFDGGEYRDVSWGTRKRGLWEIQAGWLEGDLVVLSRASDADARETFRLAPDGQRLVVRVDVRSGSERLALTRTFARD